MDDGVKCKACLLHQPVTVALRKHIMTQNAIFDFPIAGNK